MEDFEFFFGLCDLNMHCFVEESCDQPARSADADTV